MDRGGTGRELCHLDSFTEERNVGVFSFDSPSNGRRIEKLLKPEGEGRDCPCDWVPGTDRAGRRAAEEWVKRGGEATGLGSKKVSTTLFNARSKETFHIHYT